jgi:arylsulfatase A-like enzyme
VIRSAVHFRLHLGAVALAASVLSAVAFAAADDRPPNVILLMTDDQGYGDLGCHGNGMIQTPNLDRLARESVRFTDFHVDPTCSETRSALMTGRYSSRTGVWHTVMGRSILHREETTMAEVFAQAGYRTGIFGKWHLGDNAPYRPQDRGFQESLIHGGGGVGQTPDYWGNDYFDDTYLHNGSPEPQQGYCTDVFFAAALRFIQAHRERPFFCYVATNAPHGPYRVAPEYSGIYAEKGVPRPMAEFYGMIHNIDENVGRLRQRLAEWGLEQNTILIFLTDNGSAAGSGVSAKSRATNAAWKGYNAGMRGAKGSEYEGGHRVPCFVHWPAKLEGDREVSQLAAHFDLLPTLIELCGLPRPSDLDLDGRSLRPLLWGEGDWPQRTLVVHSQRVDHPEKWRKCAVMTEQWRLVNGKELYDLQDDPGQTRDVAAEQRETVARLRAAYEQWWEHVNDRFDDACRIPLSVAPGASQVPGVVRLTAHDWHAPLAEVPWNQDLIQGGAAGNGFWEVEVARAGDYDISLARWPREMPNAPPLTATEARLVVGGIDEEQAFPAGAGEATFRVSLPAGPARLQTWLTEKNGASRGAYYVYITPAGNGP